MIKILSPIGKNKSFFKENLDLKNIDKKKNQNDKNNRTNNINDKKFKYLFVDLDNLNHSKTEINNDVEEGERKQNDKLK